MTDETKVQIKNLLAKMRGADPFESRDLAQEVLSLVEDLTRRGGQSAERDGPSGEAGERPLAPEVKLQEELVRVERHSAGEGIEVAKVR